eukprot:XP_010647299.1 PREDICTED: probable LRR receptor-like serine/threonine-protein kinase At5g10290 isoform X5 [Vitis vinifera]
MSMLNYRMEVLSCAQWGPCVSLHWSLGMMPLKMEFVLAALILSCFHSFVLSDSQGDALYALKNSLNASSKQLMDWHPNEVDPCSWSNVVCDSSNNVISVTLSFMQLSGTLSPKIGILNTLSTLTLEGNGITGEIPEELGNLSNLTTLNLGNNRLTGEIPSSLGNLKKLRFFFTGNGLNCGRNFPHLCASDNDSGGSHKPKIGLIVGIVGGLIGLLLFATVLFFLWKGSCRGYKQEIYVDVAGL